MTHWRTPRDRRSTSWRELRELGAHAFFLLLFILSFAGILMCVKPDKPELRKVHYQAPPYYECNGPKATRHPRCDAD